MPLDASTLGDAGQAAKAIITSEPGKPTPGGVQTLRSTKTGVIHEQNRVKTEVSGICIKVYNAINKHMTKTLSTQST